MKDKLQEIFGQDTEILKQQLKANKARNMQEAEVEHDYEETMPIPEPESKSVGGRAVIRVRPPKEETVQQKIMLRPDQKQQLAELVQVTNMGPSEIMREAWDFFYRHHFIEDGE